VTDRCDGALHGRPATFAC